MADGDVVYNGLPQSYRSNYTESCADSFDAEECAHSLAEPWKQSVQTRGPDPFNFMQQMCMDFSDQIPSNPVRVIDEAAAQFANIEGGIDIARNVIREAVDNHFNGSNFPDYSSLCHRYLDANLERDYLGRIPLVQEHRYGLSHKDLMGRIKQMRPFLDQERTHWVKILNETNDVKKLRRRSLKRHSLNDSAW